MTINVSNNNPRVNYTATSGQTAFTIPFDYFDDGDISVYKNGTLLTIGTHYSISLTTVTLVTGATVGDKIAITRDVPLERTTDLTSTYNAASLNDQLDRLVAQVADLDDRVSRSISLNDYEVGVSLDLPATADRLGKTIQFNASTGALEVGPSGDELTSIASIASEITALDGISSNITTVAGAISNVNSVGTNISSVNSVAGSISNVNNVNTNIANVNLVGASIANVNDVADSIDQVELVAGSISNVDTVALANANIGTVAGAVSNINTLASSVSNVALVAGALSNINTTVTNLANINAVGNNIDDVNDVANVITKVTTVADNIANVNTLSSQAANIGTLAAISGSINSLGGISSDITTLAAVASDIGTAASNAASAESAKNAAEAARDATLAAYDSFDDRYLGAKSVEPTLDNDGNPLVSGSLYFDTNTDTMKLYVGSSWVAAYVTGTGVIAASGGTMTGDLNFNDNVKAKFGAGSDLQIYHDGFNSFIKDAGTGYLIIQASAIGFANDGNSENLAFFAQDGAVNLYYDNAAKLATTSTGIDVTGTVTADGLTVDGTDTEAATSQLLKVRNSTTGEAVTIGLYAKADNGGDGNSGSITFDAGADGTATNNELRFSADHQTDTNPALSIKGNGDISFYEDTGVTPKFVWKAADERLGIGTSSPSSALTVQADLGALLADTSGTRYIEIVPPQTSNSFVGEIGTRSSHALALNTVGTERMRITPTGSVGIGTSSPSKSFVVSDGGAMGIELSPDDAGQGYSRILNYDRTASAYEPLYIEAEDLRFSTGTSATERMRIDSSGNVGIGTSSPSSYHSPADNLVIGSSGDNGLTIVSDATSGGTICFADGTSDGAQYAGFIDYQHNGDYMRFGTTVGTERMRITSSGLVGINEAAPHSGLHVKGAGSAGWITVENTTVGNYSIVDFLNDSGTRVGYVGTYNGANAFYIYGAQSGPMQFFTNATERMRLDSSGNLLVGTTTTDTTAATGFTVQSDGQLFLSADSQHVATMTRLTNDGDILTFRRSAIGGAGLTTVGSIASVGGANLAIGTGDTGIRFVDSNDQIYPYNMSTGANRDASIDVGTSGARFKDLYLSGGVYLGGTGAANKLDDYEEGTWTPAYEPTTGAFTAITTIGTGRYTKIGRLVHIQGSIRTSGTLTIGTASGNLQITGLPFTNSSQSSGAQSFSHQSWNLGTDILNTGVAVNPSVSYLLLYKNTLNGSSFPFGNITVAEMDTGGGSFSNLLNFALTYTV